MSLSPRLPRSLVRTGRVERTAIPLSVIAGAIPPDLSGSLFVVAPAGTVRPTSIAERTTMMVGDGLICRFDLSASKIELTTRLARTHDFVADELTSSIGELSPFRFTSAGLVRIGLLGTRDFANTAFIPMKQGADTRMLLTYDAGRPVEIDPATLEVLGPIGGRHEWRAEALREAAFPIVLSPAHPSWDRSTQELFTINYGRGALNFAATVPLVNALEQLPHWAQNAFERIASIAGVEAAYRWAVKLIGDATTQIDDAIESFMDRYLPDVPDTFTDLVRWDGSGKLRHYRLVSPDGREVGIQQSVHQIAVTKRYVVVLETAFKIGFASAFNDPAPTSPAVDRLARAMLTRPQISETVFYVVPRAALDDPNLPRGDDGVRRVTCRKVVLPMEADHFVANYDDAGDKITLHVAHAPATDLGEWIRPYDVSAFDYRDIPNDLHGMMAVGAMDIGRFARYVIDGATGAVTDEKIISDDPRSWAISLYAGSAINTEDALPSTIDHLYWCTVGFFPELLTDFVFDMYRDYAHRQVPISAIRSMGSTGKPSAIVRLDTSSLSIGGSYLLPPGMAAGSMQHVPGAGAGYLVGTVYTDTRTELWILDAADLERGPIARLAAPGVELGFSLHTAWLPQIAPRTPSYRITARDELSRHVHHPRLEREFETHLYPRFE